VSAAESTTLRRSRRDSVAGLPLPIAVAAVAIWLAAGAFVLYMGRGSSFHVDDWSFMLYRNGHSAAVFLDPHNEHLSLLPIVLYKTLFKLVGTGHFEVFRAALIITNLVAAGLVLIALTRFVAPVVALLLVIPLLLMGPAWSALYSPFQISFAGSVAFGIGAVLALEARTRRRDVLASALLVGSLACSGLGLAWVVLVAVELALRDRRRVWVIAAPVVLYGLWYLAYGQTSEGHHFAGATSFVLNAAAAAVGAYAGLDVTWGRSLVVAALAAAVWRLYRIGRVPARTAGAVAGAVAFWGLTGLVRDPASFGESRYLLAGATFVVLAAAPLLPRREPTRGVLAAGAVAVAVALLAGSSYFYAGRTILVDGNQPLYARLQALEQARPAVKDPAFVADPLRAAEVAAKPYFSAIDRFGGSPALSLAKVRTASADTRQQFDQAMVGAEGLALVPATDAPAGAPPAVVSGAAKPSGACIVLTGGPVAVTLPRAGVIVQPGSGGPASVALRRLGDDAPGAPTLNAPARARSELRLPADRMSDPWHATISGPAGTRVCGFGG